MAPKPKHWLERLAASSHREASGCVVSSLAPSSDYGHLQINVDGKQVSVSKLVYEHFHGALPEGHIVRHTCDNPPCWNPYHLISGTKLDNANDRDKRGRTALGENNGSTKLTVDAVRKIRASYVPRKVSIRSLARRYGVSYATIRDVINNVSWRNI